MKPSNFVNWTQAEQEWLNRFLAMADRSERSGYLGLTEAQWTALREAACDRWSDADMAMQADGLVWPQSQEGASASLQLMGKAADSMCDLGNIIIGQQRHRRMVAR